VFKDEELKKYKVVIFLEHHGRVLNDEQQAALRALHQAGAASSASRGGGTSKRLPPIRHMFHISRGVQTAPKVEDANFPGMDRFQAFLATSGGKPDASARTSTIYPWMRRPTSPANWGRRRQG
jgi:hypothetical protein